MKPFTSKHCIQYLTKSSPLSQREEVKSLAEKEFEQDLKRERRMPGFAEKPEGGIQRVANKNKLEAKRKMSQPTAPKPTPLNQGYITKEMRSKTPEEQRAIIKKQIVERERIMGKRKPSAPEKALSKLREQYREKTGPTGINPDKRTFKPKDLSKKGSEADEATLKRMSSTKYKK